MSTPESLMEDVKYFFKKVTFLDGNELKALCRDLDLPVKNLAGHDMVEQLQEKVLGALESYRKMPSRESEKILLRFRYNLLLKSKFLERYLEKVKRSAPE